MYRWLKINIRPLVMDIGVVFYSGFFLYGIIGDSKGLLHNSSRLKAIALVFLMQAVLPLYMGKIIESYEPVFEMKYGEAFRSFMKFIFGVTIFFVFVAGFSALQYIRLPNSPMIVTGIIFGAISAITFGFLTGSSIFKGKYNENYSEFLKSSFISILVFTSLFAVYLGLMAALINFLSAVIPVIIITVIAILIVMYIYLNKKIPELSLNSTFRKFYSYAGDIILTLALITTLSFLLEIYSVSMMKKPGGDFIVSFLILILTGYLPVRLFVEFEPPFTPVTVITGILSSVYFIYRIAVF